MERNNGNIIRSYMLATVAWLNYEATNDPAPFFHQIISRKTLPEVLTSDQTIISSTILAKYDEGDDIISISKGVDETITCNLFLAFLNDQTIKVPIAYQDPQSLLSEALLLIRGYELLSNPKIKVWEHELARSAKEIETTFERKYEESIDQARREMPKESVAYLYFLEEEKIKTYFEMIGSQLALQPRTLFSSKVYY